MSAVQKVITSNGGEILTAKMENENMALVREERHRWTNRQEKYHVIMFNPREAWELLAFIQANVPRYTRDGLTTNFKEGE